MLEKIIAKLKQQRAQSSTVSDRTIEDMAKTYAVFIIDDATLEKADFTETLKSLDGNIGFVAAEAVKKIKSVKSEHNPPTPPTHTSPKADDGGNIPEWAKAMLESTKLLTEKISNLEGEKITTNRATKLKTLLTDLPEFYTLPIVSSFTKMAFKDDSEFESYLQEVKTQTESFTQKVKEQGMNFTTPPKTVETPIKTGETTVLSDARKIIQTATKNQNTNK